MLDAQNFFQEVPMKFSMKFLYIQLLKHYDGVRLHLPGEENPYCSSFRHIPEGYWMPSRDTLYLLTQTTQDLLTSALPKSTPFIIIDHEMPRFSPYPYLYFPDVYHRSQIVNDILSIFQRYSQWSQEVTNALLRNQSLQDILDITQTVEENPIYFADPSFKMLAHNFREMDQYSVIVRYQVKYHYLPFNVMMDLVETGELELLHNTPHAFYNKTKSFGTNFISKAIRSHNKLWGNFFIIESYHNLNQCDVEIAEELGNLIAASIYENSNYLTSSSLYHEHFMIDILEQTLQNEISIRNQLRPLGWSLEGNYRLLAIHMPNDEEALKRNTIVLLTNTWNAQAFLYNEYVITIYNEPPRKYSRMCEYIHRFLQLMNRYGALSELFYSFSNMHHYFQQASYTLQNAKRGSGKNRLFFYENYYLQHLLHLAGDDLPIYEPANRLHQYDAKHHCEYCRTLYTYLLHNQNAVKTAQIMFLHRNTLKYRMEKIRDIIQVPLEHPLICQRLLLSLQALECDNNSLMNI